MAKSILFVDDEEHILKALKRLFMQTEYDTFFAISGMEALEILAKEKIDLIISDMRMPHMDGYQLLRQVKSKYPSVLRAILSGYADDKEIIGALQDGSTRTYIMKPWDNEKLLCIIKQLLEFEETFKSKNVLEVMNSLDSLPTLPAIYNKVCHLIEENSDIEMIANVIEEDQVITAKILKIVNSVFYGNKTGSIKQAIVLLGLSNVKNIVLSISIIYNSNIGNNVIFTKEILWRHVSITNKIVHLIYEKLLKKKLPNISATAGLLHDIGRLILLQNYPQKYKQVTDSIRMNANSSICTIEANILTISHQEIGGYLLNWWGMPQPIVEAAAFHHTPFDKRIIERELVSVVHIADYYSWEKLRIDNYSKLDTDAFLALGIKQQDCEFLIEKLKCS